MLAARQAGYIQKATTQKPKESAAHLSMYDSALNEQQRFSRS